MKHQYRFIGGKINKDVDERLVPSGQYIDANNIRIISGEGGDTGVVKKFKGTTLLETFTNGVNPDFSAVLGFKHYKGFIYVFGLNSTSGNTELWQYEISTDTATLLFDRALGNGTKDAPFNIDIVDDENVEGSERLLMYFNDRRNEPQKVNILKLRSSSTYYVNLSDQLVTKPSSLFPPTIAGGTSGTVNNIKDKNFQFAYRWIYEDGEISPLTPFSGTDIEKIDYEYTNGDIVGYFYLNAGALYYNTSNDEGSSFYGDHLVAIIIDEVHKYFISERLYTITGPNTIAGSIWMYDTTTPNRVVKVYSGTNGDDITDLAKEFIMPSDETWYGVYMTRNGLNAYICGSLNDGVNDWIYIAKLGEDSFSRLFYGKDSNQGQDRALTDIAASINGDRLICARDYQTSPAASSTKIFTSNDSGQTLDEIKTITYPRENSLSRVACSSDGKYMYYCIYKRNTSSGNYELSVDVYISNDYGSSFVFAKSIDVGNAAIGAFSSLFFKHSIACSGDGKYIYISTSADSSTATKYDNYILFSSNFGTTFEKLSLTGTGTAQDYKLLNIGCSTFGDVSSYSYNGNLYKSSDFGASYSSILSTTIDAAIMPSSEYILGRDYVENNYNFIDVTVKTGSKHVTNIEIYAKERENGNFFRIKEYDKERDVISDNTTQTYRFKNDGIYQILPIDQQSRYFDNIPLTANSQAIVDKRLMYANYVDGRSLEYSDGTKVSENASVTINETAYSPSNFKTLKTGTLQSYGILYKDAGGRPASILPIDEVTIPYWYEDSTKQVFLASVSISHYAPEWASTYSIVRKKPLFDYDVVYRFEEADIRNGKIYLLLPSDVNAEVGYKLIYAGDAASFSDISESFNIVEVVDNSLQSQTLNLSEGKWIVINNPSSDGFTTQDVVNNADNYLSGCFYVQKTFDTDGDIVYYETPYIFNVTYDAVNDVYLHEGSSNQTFGGVATVLMDDDYDTIIKEFPYREEYKYSPLTSISTLGRGWFESEDIEEVRRYSSIIWSDVYVFDNNYNGLSNFNPLSVKALPTKYGSINHISYYYSNLLALQDDIVSIVPVDKNILTTATGTGDVTQSTNVLGVFNPITSIFGCQSPESFSHWGNMAFFVDKKRGAVISLQGDNMSVVSNDSMSEYFRNILKSETGLIYSCYNPEVKAFFLGLPSESKTVAYRPDAGFSYFLDYVLPPCDNDGYNLYSSNLNDLYSHDTNNTLNLFFGAQKDADITFSANQGGSAIKVFEAMLLESTDEWYVNLTNNLQSTFIPTANFEDREGYKFAYIPMDDSTADADETLATRGVGIFASILGTELTMSSAFPIQSVSINDDLWHINGGIKYFIGIVTNVSHIDKKITVSSVLSTPISGDFIYSRKSNYIDGNKIRDYYAKIKLTHSGSGNVELYAVGIEVKESKN